MATFEEVKGEVIAFLDASNTTIKGYVDAGDAAALQAAKNYADGLLNAENLDDMQATVATLKAALDGDDATPGLQAWLNANDQLSAVIASAAQNATDIETISASLATINTTLTNSINTLSQRVTDEVATLNSTINTKDAATNARIDDIEAGVAADKVAQTAKDAAQDAAIQNLQSATSDLNDIRDKANANEAAITQQTQAITDEANARVAADAAFNTRITTAESAISDLQTNSGDFATKTQVKLLFAEMATSATRIFQ